MRKDLGLDEKSQTTGEASIQYKVKTIDPQNVGVVLVSMELQSDYHV